MLGSNRPRRFASSTDAVMSRSSSLSVRYLTALGRSLGSTCRFEAVSVAASVAETRLVGCGTFAALDKARQIAKIGKDNRIETMKGPGESGQICSVGRRKIAKKIAKNKRCYANTLRPAQGCC